MTSPKNPKPWNRQNKYVIKKRYGLTKDEFELLWQQCRGLCVICELRPPLCVDHDHDTKKVRGLLCTQCNTGIGMLGDDQLRIAKAIIYLVKHERTDKPLRPVQHKGRRSRGDKPLPKADPRRPNRKVR